MVMSFGIGILLLALIPAAIASSKGHSFLLFYIFGLLLWPVALIVSLVIHRDYSCC